MCRDCAHHKGRNIRRPGRWHREPRVEDPLWPGILDTIDTIVNHAFRGDPDLLGESRSAQRVRGISEGAAEESAVT